MKTRVLVTGISGYIGLHVGAELLRQGYEVVGTVRSNAKATKAADAIARVAPTKALSFAKAQLLSDSGWDEAMEGCNYVIHVASPFVLREPKDESDLIVPAVEGTKRVVSAAKRAGVKRLVLTSTTLAMVAGKETGRYGTDSWSDTAAPIGAYAKSKTLAERAAWELVTGSSMELVVINPGVVFGPPLDDESDGQTVTMIANMIGGKMPMIPNVAMGMVDVRDVARLHVKAMTAKRAAGQRFIASTAKPIEMAHIAKVLRSAGYSKVPSIKAPDFAIRLMSLFDREAKGMLPNLGRRAEFQNRATFDILDWEPTPMEESFREMASTIAG